jgi:hypothetical protein
VEAVLEAGVLEAAGLPAEEGLDGGVGGDRDAVVARAEDGGGGEGLGQALLRAGGGAEGDGFRRRLKEMWDYGLRKFERSGEIRSEI